MPDNPYPTWTDDPDPIPTWLWVIVIAIVILLALLGWWVFSWLLTPTLIMPAGACVSPVCAILIALTDPTGWDGYVYHGTSTRQIEETCPLCGQPLTVWYGRYYDGVSFDQITGCEGACNARDIYTHLNQTKD